MHADCVEAIGKALGRRVSAAEVRAYEAAINTHGRQLARTDPDWRSLTFAERTLRAAEAAQAEALGMAHKRAARAASNLLAQARESAALMDRAPAMRSTQQFHAALFERLRQAENYINGVRHEAIASVVDTVYAVEPQFLRLIENRAAVADFVREVYGQDTGNPVAKRAAKAYTEAMGQMRVRQNSAGADIGKLDYGYLPQPHDVGRIARAGKDGWVDFVAPLLARERYLDADGLPMGEAEFRSTLAAAYDTLSTEGRNKLVPGKSGRGSRAARFDEAHRVIHFKDGDAHLAYLDQFGRGSMLDAITGHIGAAAKNIGLLEQFGANPNATYRLLKDLAEKYDNLAGGRESGATLDMVWDTLSGTTAQPVNPLLASAGQAVRNFTTAAKLQGVMLSSVTDVPLQLLAAKYNGVPLGKALHSSLRGFGGDTKREALRLGIATESISSEMAQWHTDNLAQGWTSKLANTTMRLTLVEAWTHALRRGFSLTLSSHLGDMVRTDWTDLKPQDRERLKAAGVTVADWRIWQRAPLEEFQGDHLLTKNGIRAIEGVDQADANRAIARLLGFLDQESHTAVLAPDNQTRAALTQGTRPGTWGGEITRSLMLFKSFPMAVAIKHLRRLRSIPTTSGKVGYSVAMLVGLQAFGALALQLKEMAAGKDPRDMTDAKFWGAAFAQGGGFGVFGDILYTGMGGNARGGQSNWTALLGPVFGTGADALNVTLGNMGQAMEGKETHAGAETMRFVKGNFPIINLWYLRATLDHMFFHEMQESLSPGYLRKMRRRVRKEYGQDFWWEPGEKLPDRAPDLEAAVGER